MALSTYHTYGSFNKEKRRKIVAKIVKELRNVEFDALAVRGVSGLIMAPIVAYLLNKHVIVVRKPKDVERSHANEIVESPITTGDYVIFDDFVGSGETAREIQRQIRGTCPLLVCVGGYVWVPDRRFGSSVLNVKDLNS